MEPTEYKHFFEIERGFYVVNISKNELMFLFETKEGIMYSIRVDKDLFVYFIVKCADWFIEHYEKVKKDVESFKTREDKEKLLKLVGDTIQKLKTLKDIKYV
jgi:hypothetical protein